MPRIDKIVISAVKQSHKAWKPVVNELVSFKEFKAIWHGKRWMKQHGRTGTITAIPAMVYEPYHIIDWQ